LFEAHYFYARNCRAQGNHEKAAQLFERAAALNQNDFRALGLLADEYRALGDWTTAWRRRGSAWAGFRSRSQRSPMTATPWLSGPISWPISATGSGPRNGRRGAETIPTIPS
jgi:hypothetical protein